MKNSKGFTLIEIIVVIAVIAILSGIGAFSANRYLPVYRLREAIRDVASTLQNARLAAVRGSNVCAVTFNLPAGSYIAFVDNNQDFIFNAGDVQIDNKSLANYTYVNYGLAGVTFPVNADVVPSPTISFNNRGLPIYSGGVIGTFIASLQNTQGRQRQVSVSPAGNVRVQ